MRKLSQNNMGRSKEKTKKVNKKAKILIILVVLILIVAMSIMIYFKSIGKTKEVEIASDKALGILGFSAIFDNSTGYLKTSEVAKHLEEVTIKRLPQVYNDVKDYGDFKLKIYYNENKWNIRSWFGITNYEQFSKFVEKLKNTDVDLESWIILNVSRSSFVDKSDIEGYSYVEYQVSYEKNKVLNFSVYFARNAGREPVYVVNFMD